MFKINVKYILIFFFFHALTCVIYGFGVYTLTQRGFDYTRAGMCLSFSSLLAFILQNYLASCINKNKKVGTFEVVVLLTILIFVFMFINIFIRKASLLLAIVFILSTSSYIALEAFINSLPGEFFKKDLDINYSRARAFGSLSYALFCILFGKLSVKYSYLVILIFSCFFSFFLFIFSVFIRKDYLELKTGENKELEEDKLSFKNFLKENKAFVLLIFFLGLIYFGYICFDNFMLAVVYDLNGSSDDLGSILGFKAILETVSIFFLFPFLVKRFKLEKILSFSAFSFVLKIAFQTFAINIKMLYFAQIMQIFSFALMSPGMVLYINKNLNKNALTWAQVLNICAIVVPSFFVGLIAGNITDNFGIKITEYVALIVSLIGFVGYFMGIRKNGK